MNVLQSDWEGIMLFIIFILKLTQYIIVSFLLSNYLLAVQFYRQQ